MQRFDFQSRTRLVFGTGEMRRLGTLAAELGFKRTLVIADRGIVGCGYVDRAFDLLSDAGVAAFSFHDFSSNPDSKMVSAGRDFALGLDVDSLVAIGGGSSMDCAKGINFVLTGGGAINDYQGWAKARNPMLPMIAVPTTAGTGSEAQSYALISDAATHVKMACGAPGAAFTIAILDPELTVSQPRLVTATSGIDAIGHAVETWVTTKRNAVSEMLSRQAWSLLERNFERVIAEPRDIDARAAMQLGAYVAGLAIENSMLGAAHACANPLTAQYGVEHGIAVGLMLPHVVRWNGAVEAARYAELLRDRSASEVQQNAPESLVRRLGELLELAGLPATLRAAGIADPDFSALSADAATQWTGTFNPRPFDQVSAAELYRNAA